MNREEIKRKLRGSDYAFSGVTGGQPRRTYYRPDGVPEVKIVRNPVHTVYRDADGKTHKAELDQYVLKGYSLTPPENPKIHCEGCGKWHDTQKEVTQCKKQRRQWLQRQEKWAQKKLKKNDEVSELKDQVVKLTEMIQEMQNGTQIQRTSKKRQPSRKGTPKQTQG